VIQITIYADEVLFRLDQLPRRIRSALREKYGEIFERVNEELFRGVPGQYLDPNFIETGVTEQGSLLIGWIESSDKSGVYSIFPSKANFLRFVAKSGDLVFTKRVLRHPYLKGAPIVERYLRESKPWILDMLEDAVVEAL